MIPHPDAKDCYRNKIQYTLELCSNQNGKKGCQTCRVRRLCARLWDNMKAKNNGHLSLIEANGYIAEFARIKPRIESLYTGNQAASAAKDTLNNRHKDKRNSPNYTYANRV